MSSTPIRAGIVFAGVMAAAALAMTALPAFAAAPSTPLVHSKLIVRSYAAVGSESNPDDITRLGDSIYVAFQNGVGPKGEPSPAGIGSSTIQQYSLTGVAGKSWSVVGKVDGLTADPSHQRLVLTVNEDGNSSFFTLDPAKTAGLKQYSYQGLTHGGGTDAIAVKGGTIIVSASAPSNPTGPAAYIVSLTASSAKLTPLLADNSKGVSANTATAGQPVQLALTDPDSNQIVPRSSARFGGDFMLDAQADKQLIFVTSAGRDRSAIRVLSVPQPLDDTVFRTRSHSTLWVTDPTHNTVDAITGSFTAGEVISSVTPDIGAAYLAVLGLNDGTLSPISELSTVVPKGLLFTSPDSRTGSDGHGGHEGDQPSDH